MPPRDIDDLQQEIQELFSDLWQVPRFSGLRHGFRPEADVYLTEDPPALEVLVALPGVDPEKVEVVATARGLSIAGTRERPQVPGSRVQQMELEYGPFQRLIQINTDVDPAGASATYERGLLRITLPLAPKPPAQERVAIVVRRRA
jgi:HSP20 family protein